MKSQKMKIKRSVAATLAVVYPHMTGIGGDGFWLLHAPGQPMRSIDACGAAGAAVRRDLYGSADSIPWRGPLAANTVAASAGTAPTSRCAPMPSSILV